LEKEGSSVNLPIAAWGAYSCRGLRNKKGGRGEGELLNHYEEKKIARLPS